MVTDGCGASVSRSGIKEGIDQSPGVVKTLTVQAYVFVTTKSPGPRAACRAIRSLPGVVRADALFGGPAVIAIVEGRDLAEMDAPIDAIVHLPGVLDTETHVVRDIEQEDTVRDRVLGTRPDKSVVQPTPRSK